MVQLLKKNQVTVVTKDGECEIHLVLDVNLNIGDINVKTEDIKVRATGRSVDVDVEEEDAEFIVPDFTSEKIKFGQVVNGEE